MLIWRGKSKNTYRDVNLKSQLFEVYYRNFEFSKCAWEYKKRFFKQFYKSISKFQQFLIFQLRLSIKFYSFISMKNSKHFSEISKRVSEHSKINVYWNLKKN